jgi:hypothetical protein
LGRQLADSILFQLEAFKSCSLLMVWPDFLVGLILTATTHRLPSQAKGTPLLIPAPIPCPKPNAMARGLGGFTVPIADSRSRAEASVRFATPSVVEQQLFLDTRSSPVRFPFGFLGVVTCPARIVLGDTKRSSG